MKTKSILLLLLVICVIAVGIVMNVNMFDSERQLSEFYVKNADALQDDAVALLAGSRSESALADKMEQITVHSDLGTVEYLAATDKGLIGIYYSESDTPLSYPDGSCKLTSTKEYYWSWSAEKEGDASGNLVKLADNWYYFETGQ